MIRHRFVLLCLSALLLAAPARLSSQTPPAGERAAGAADSRLREVVAALSSGSRRELLSLFQRHLHPSLLQRAPAERWAASYGAMYDRSRGFALDSVAVLGPTESAGLLRSSLTGWREWLAVRVEADAPHRITRLGQPSRALAAPPRPPVRATSDAERVRELGAFLDRLAAADVFSGVVLLARGDSVLFLRAYGRRDRSLGEPVRADTRFRLESITKPLTAIAVARLAEQGRLSFGDPVTRHLPGFRGHAAFGGVRIEHLLSHTSGIADYLRVCERVQPCPSPARGLDDHVRQVELAQADTPVFAPGTRWAYSNSNYVLLGKIVEAASGTPYAEYVREHVLRAAGMRGSGFLQPGRSVEGLAVGYEKELGDDGFRFREAPPEDPGLSDAAAYATAEDVFRLVRALAGGRLVGPGTVRLMTTPKPELGAPGWGYGFDVRPERGVFGHGGTWSGASNSVDHWPASGYTAVILSNYSFGRTLPREFIEMLVSGS